MLSNFIILSKCKEKKMLERKDFEEIDKVSFLKLRG